MQALPFPTLVCVVEDGLVLIGWPPISWVEPAPLGSGCYTMPGMYDAAKVGHAMPAATLPH